MLFTLGLIIGLLIAIFIIVALLFFRHPIEKHIKTTETAIKNVGPRPRGSVYIPPSESSEARARIVAQNQKEGKDTRIKDLL